MPKRVTGTPTAYADYSAATTAVSGDGARKVQPDDADRCEKILGICGEETATHREADRICSPPEPRRTFRDPRPENLAADNFAVKAVLVTRDFSILMTGRAGALEVPQAGPGGRRPPPE